MSGARQIKAGEAFVQLFAEDSRLIRTLRTSGDRVRRFAKSAKEQADKAAQSLGGIGMKLSALGGAAMTPLIASLYRFAAAGDRIDKMSIRVGMSAETLTELGHAAELCGSSLDDVEKASRKTTKTIADAIQGNVTAIGTFEKLGASVGALSGMDAESQFLTLIERLGALGDESLQTAMSMQLFGKEVGPRLLPLVKSGAGGLAAMREEARRLGLTMSQEDATSAAALTDALTRLQKAFMAVFNTLGAAVAPAFTEFVEYAAKSIASVVHWVRDNKTLIVQFAKIAAVVSGVGTVLMALAAGVTVVGMTLGAIGALAAGAFGAVATVLTTIGGVLAFLVTPLGLVTAGVVALAARFLASFGLIGEVIETAKSWFGDLRDTAVKTWGGIVDAVAAGDLELAMKIVWLSLKVIWQTGINWLLKLWNGLKHGIQTAWDETIIYLGKVLSAGVGRLKKYWNDLAAGVRLAWQTLAKGIVDSWKFVEKTVAHGIAYVMALIRGMNTSEAAKQVEDIYAQQGQQRQAAFNARVGEILEEHATKNGRIDKEQSDMADVLDAMRRERENTRNAIYDSRTKALTAELDALRKQRDAAIREAGEKRKAAADAEKSSVQRKLPDPRDLEKNMKNQSVIGTFSAFALQSLQGNRPMDRIVKATEDTAKNTRKIANKKTAVEAT